MGVVDPLGGEQERPERGAVEAAGVAATDPGAADWAGSEAIRPIDVGEAVEAAHGGQPPGQ